MFWETKSSLDLNWLFHRTEQIREGGGDAGERRGAEVLEKGTFQEWELHTQQNLFEVST